MKHNLNLRAGLPMCYQAKKTSPLERTIIMATDKTIEVGDTVFFGFNNKSEHVEHEIVSINESRKAAGVWDIERPNFYSINVKQITTT